MHRRDIFRDNEIRHTNEILAFICLESEFERRVSHEDEFLAKLSSTGPFAHLCFDQFGDQALDAAAEQEHLLHQR